MSLLISIVVRLHESLQEHKCVLDSCRHLESEGFKVTYLPVQSNGLIDLGELDKAIGAETSLVSIMTVNNEIGVIQPVKEIGKFPVTSIHFNPFKTPH